MSSAAAIQKGTNAKPKPKAKAQAKPKVSKPEKKTEVITSKDFEDPDNVSCYVQAYSVAIAASDDSNTSD